MSNFHGKRPAKRVPEKKEKPTEKPIDMVRQELIEIINTCDEKELVDLIKFAITKLGKGEVFRKLMLVLIGTPNKIKVINTK